MISCATDLTILNDWQRTPAERLAAARRLRRDFTPDWSADCEVDLHCHSFYSDGYDSPAGRVFEAWRRGMRAVAVTDHDLFDGQLEAIAAGRIFGLTVVPGAEFYTDRPGIEILAFFPVTAFFQRQWQAGVFDARVTAIRNAKQRQLQTMIARVPACFARHGITAEITADDIVRHVRNGISTKGDISVILWEKYGAELIRRGLSRDVKALHSDFTSRATELSVPLEVELDLSPAAFIGWIRATGGLAVLAHPVELRGKENLDNAAWERTLDELGAAGLDGIEIDGFRNRICPETGLHQTDLLEAMRQRYHQRHPDRPPLLATNGGDTHNQPNEIGLELGCGRDHNLRPECGRYAVVSALRARHRARIASMKNGAPD